MRWRLSREKSKNPKENENECNHWRIACFPVLAPLEAPLQLAKKRILCLIRDRQKGAVDLAASLLIVKTSSLYVFDGLLGREAIKAAGPESYLP